MSQPKLVTILPVTAEFLRSYLKDFIEGHTTLGGTSCSICGGSKSRHRIEDCFVGLAQSFLSDLED
jgi:hypothetical protein